MGNSAGSIFKIPRRGRNDNARHNRVANSPIERVKSVFNQEKAVEL
jgi:hypothetical protein